MRLDFFLPGEPPTVTAQEKGLATRNIRIGGMVKTVPFAYETAEIKSIRHAWEWMLAPYRPKETPAGPIRLITIWTFKAKGKHKPETYKDTKPDTDNLIKLFKDVMADAGFFENDSRVVDERTIKRWGSVPGIRVIVETIGKEANDEIPNSLQGLKKRREEQRLTKEQFVKKWRKDHDGLHDHDPDRGDLDLNHSGGNSEDVQGREPDR